MTTPNTSYVDSRYNTVHNAGRDVIIINYTAVDQTLQNLEPVRMDGSAGAVRDGERFGRLAAGRNTNNHTACISDVEHKPMPLASQMFTGREDYLKKLGQHFAPRNQSYPRRHFLLHGISGAGKTQICLKFVEEHSDRFWKIFWIDATSAETIELSLQDIVGKPEAQASGVKQSAESVLQWLSHIVHDWLLIFDNADGDPRVVAKYMPTGNQGNIIFTSRNPGVGGSNITRESSLKIEDMGEEDAISLLLKFAWLDESSPDMRKAASPLAIGLCCFPLAIDQAGAAIRSGLCTIDDYLTMYSEHQQRLMSHISYEGASCYGRAVYATWDVSFAAIEARAAGPDSVDAEAAQSAIAILQIFAFLHHDNIPEEIIKRAAEAPRKSEYEINSEDAARQASYSLLHPLLQQCKGGGWDSLFFRSGIQVLLSFSLIKQSVVHNAYSVHPLVHFWSHDRMSVKEQQSRCFSAKILLSLSITFEYEMNNYAFRQTLIPHIKASHIDAQAQISMLYNDDQYTKFAYVLWENRFYKDAERLDLLVMEMRSHILGTQHSDTLRSMGNLALTYYNQKRLEEAEKLQVKVMEMSSRILGTQHLDTLSSMENLALTYYKQKQLKEAEKLQVQVMEMRCQILGTQDLDTLRIMENLALTYYELKWLEEAENLQVQVMKMRSQILSTQHPDTLRSMENLALTYYEQKRLKKAEKLQVQVMEMRGQILGTQHLDTLRSLGNLALTYYEQKRLEKAEELQVQVMEMRSQILGTQHLDTLRSMENLALTYYEQKRLEKAEELQVQVMEMRSQILGTQHPDTLRSLGNLALIYYEQKQLEEVEKLQVQVMEMRCQILGTQHLDTLGSMENLALTYYEQKRLEKAEELQVQVMEMRCQILGTQHLDTLRSMENLALTYYELKWLEEADSFQVQVMEMRSQILGTQHPDTLRSMENLALTYYEQKRLEKAAKLQVQVMEMRSQILGTQHPDTLRSIGNLALAYCEQKRLEEAEKLDVQVMEMKSHTLGPEHPDTLTSMVNLAYTWKSQKKDEEALNEWQNCRDSKRSMHGWNFSFVSWSQKCWHQLIALRKR